MLVTGCLVVESNPPPAERAGLGGDSQLRERFEDAERRTGVPAELLATLSYIETRLRQVEGDHAHGAGDDLSRALRQLDVDALADVIALAASSARPQTLDQWLDALAPLAGDARTTEARLHLSRGWQAIDAQGAWLVCSARLVVMPAANGDGIGSLRQELGYPGAIWNPAHSSNYSDASRGAASINYIIIHTVQGSYAGAISWFKNSSSNVSAHYVIRSSDGEVAQMVDDRDIAWHDACFNSETIGIEHEGYVQDPAAWYTEAMYMASAEVTAWLADQYNIPKDRAHIMGHGEAPDCSSHTDPGSGWDWDHYMQLVQSGGVPTFDAAYAAQNTPSQMVSGHEAVVFFEFVNHSNITWGLNETRLGTADPIDRESSFYVQGNWLSPSRPTGADHSTYVPGATGRFTFAIRAPEVTEPTTFTESFQLVQEGRSWFGPTVAMTIEVLPEGWTGDPDPGDPFGGADHHGSGSGENGSNNVTGGCRAAGSGASTGGCAILLACAVLMRRRRRR